LKCCWSLLDFLCRKNADHHVAAEDPSAEIGDPSEQLASVFSRHGLGKEDVDVAVFADHFCSTAA
jgi:hypothetical protein